jgi:hypothetical protein
MKYPEISNFNNQSLETPPTQKKKKKKKEKEKRREEKRPGDSH